MPHAAAPLSSHPFPGGDLGSTGHGAQTGDYIAAASDANQAFYAAGSARHNGPEERAWAYESCVSWVGPSQAAPVMEWVAVRPPAVGLIDRWAQISVRAVGTTIHVNGDLAWAIGQEINKGKLKNGNAFSFTTVVTSIFEKRDGRWLMVLHHANAPLR
ncbi:MAG: hypothetical protein EXR05_11905 [Acetobacteraceae bacterium]|nr:hypothetical protein [Acetobacteraceae bacterium]